MNRVPLPGADRDSDLRNISGDGVSTDDMAENQVDLLKNQGRYASRVGTVKIMSDTPWQPDRDGELHTESCDQPDMVGVMCACL